MEFWRKWALTFEPGNFHLDEVLLIKFLMRKRTIKKKIAQKYEIKSDDFYGIWKKMSHNFWTRQLSLNWSFVHWIPCEKTHN